MQIDSSSKVENLLAKKLVFFTRAHHVLGTTVHKVVTVCPGSSDPPEKIFNIFASENEGYTIY